MEQFNLDDFYRGVSNFWDSIAPIIIVHLIALFALKWTVGANWHFLEKIEFHLSTDRYKRWRKILDEFDIRPKVFFALIICVFFYFSLFNNLLGIVNSFAPFEFSYSEMDMINENRPLDTLVTIASFGTETNPDIYDIYNLKQSLVYEYKSKHPDRYDYFLGWYKEKFSEWFTFYLLSIIFLLFTIIILIYRIRNKSRQKTPFIRFIVILVFSITMIIITRFQAEQFTEKRFYYETIFITDELHTDSSRHSLADEEVQLLKNNLYTKLKNPRPPDIFWISRYIEYIPFITRTYPKTTNEKFEQLYGSSSNQIKNP